MKLKFTILAFSAISVAGAFGQSYTSNSATTAWNASRWNNSADGPAYTSAYTANNAVSFTAGSYSFAGMGAALNVGNVTLASNVTVNFASIGSTFATNGTVRTFDIGSGSLFDFQGQSISTAAGTGFIKTGNGVFATGAYATTANAQSFTINSGTVIARGTTGLGNGSNSILNLNGGTVASNGSRSFDNTRFGSGIVVGGNVQFGELATVVSLASSTANLSFANNVSLGSATRTFTQGNNGTQTFSGIVSNSSGGITFAANANTDGRFDLTNTANTFTGDVSITGGEVRFTADGSLGNAANDIILDGGRFGIASGATVTLGAGRQISVGDGAGTGISAPGAGGVLTYNGAIANKSGETGSWAKQGQGTLILGGISTYTGNTDINNGTLQLTTGNDRLPTGTVVSLGQSASANIGTLDLNGRSQQIKGLVSTTGTNATTGNNTVTSATTSTLTIDGTDSYSYGNGTNENSGIISGAISLVKSGSGTQTLGDTNTYTGTTIVNAGKLVINGNISTSVTTVNISGTLGGSGTVGALTVKSGGILAPGNSPGILNAGNSALEAGSTLGIEIDGATAGTQYDQLNVTGTVSLAGLLTITMGSYLPPNDTLFFILANDGTDAITGTFSNASLNGATYTFGSQDFKISYFGNSAGNTFTGGNDVVLMAVPEPAAALLGGLGLLTLMRRRRH